MNKRWKALALAVPVMLSARAVARAEPVPVPPVTAPAPAPVTAPVTAIMADVRTTPIAPGVTLTSFERLEARGWVQGYLVKADLTNPAVSADLLYPGSVAAAQPLSRIAAEAGAVAGVNGDFFDIKGSKAPLSAVVAGGALLKGPVTGWPHVAGVGQDRVGRLAEMALEGALVLPGGRQPLAALNQHIPEDGIGIFTSAWGATPRKWAALWGRGVREVTVRNGVVTAVSETMGSGAIPADSLVLIGREKGAAVLAKLKVGDKVSVTYAPRTGATAPFKFAVGGSDVLLKDGRPAADLEDKDAAPRTAIGFSAGGRTMFLVAVDGRSQASRGVTSLEMARLLQEQGAASALLLDGGGSTTMVARTPGASAATVTNTPSDGEERYVPNGVGIFTTPGSGKLSGLTVRPRYAAAHADRVFPGLVRTFSVTGYDETYGPALVGSFTWNVTPADGGLLLGDGLFVAAKPGLVSLKAHAGSVAGGAQVRVLGPLDRVVASPQALSLHDGPVTFAVTGADAEGYTAPIEPPYVTLSYDTTQLAIAATEQGAFRVEPKGEQVAALVTVTVAGKQTYLPVTRGHTQALVADFERPTGWTLSAFPSAVTGAMTSAPGRRGQGLRLAYDFSTTQATRAVYAETALPFPGKPSSISLWVKGDGNGAWLRAVLTDAAGASFTVNLSRQVAWTGWKYLQTEMPTGMRYPVTLSRIYPVEPDKARQYKGELVLDDLVAWSPAEVALPARPAAAPDPLFAKAGEMGAGRWTFAVLSRSLIAAATPQSDRYQQARKALEAIAAARPNFLVVAGDFVDKADPYNLAMAKLLLAEKVSGHFPVHYLPGGREAGDLFANFRVTFDNRGTRVILLNTAAGTLRTSDFQQLADLKKALDDAETNSAVKNVVVVAVTPLQRLDDQREARLLAQWLSEFRTRSGGKGAAYLSGQAEGAGSAVRVEGVPYVSIGVAPDWTLIGVDADAKDWLRAELRTVGPSPGDPRPARS